jgi:hypothetical protein
MSVGFAFLTVADSKGTLVSGENLTVLDAAANGLSAGWWFADAESRTLSQASDAATDKTTSASLENLVRAAVIINPPGVEPTGQAARA